MNELEQLRALCATALELDAKAAPGPWTNNDPWGGRQIESPDPHGFRGSGEKSLIIYDEGGHDEDDAAFICSARTGYPLLARVVEAMLNACEHFENHQVSFRGMGTRGEPDYVLTARTIRSTALAVMTSEGTN